MKWQIDENGNYIYGDYVLTAVKNAFNNKDSYWISKKGYTVAFYCFSYITNGDVMAQLSNIQVWCDYFEDRIKKLED